MGSSCLGWAYAPCQPHSPASLSKLVEVRDRVPGSSSSKIILEDSVNLGVLGHGLKLAQEKGGNPRKVNA